MSSSSTRAKFITRFVAPSILLSTLAHAEGIDVVFKIDESGSMGDDITAVKANVSTIFNNLPTGSHVGLVGFGATGTHGYKPHLHRSLTTDSILFQNALDELVASGGIEPGYDAVFLSATDSLPSGSLGFTG
ncbi:MAG: VWA domain-containing protein, partial [Pseudomonadota bacterium]|nr:VWA domain-containing protein [Pseudomonadota bacterium]